MPQLQQPHLERPDLERPSPIPTAQRGGSFYLALGAVVVAAVIGAYVLVGAPGLYQPVAKGPSQATDVAQQPAPSPAPPATR
jgi:hypothetical protein